MSLPDPLVLGTRGSELALWQANFVKSKLEADGRRVEIQTISTRGDEVQDVPISDIGDEAVFTQELDRALLTGDIHVAVHSLKDLPSHLPGGIALAAVSDREVPHDAFVAHPSLDGGLDDLPTGATVATASLRRQAQIRAWRSDLHVVPVRGNVDTRLEKLDDSDWEGMILASAGLLRMGLSARIRERIDPDVMVPAVGQGALGIACAEENGDVHDLLRRVLHHDVTGYCTTAERAFLQRTGGGCQVPMGAWARMVDDGDIVLDACVASLDGDEAYRDRTTFAPDDARPATSRSRSGPDPRRNSWRPPAIRLSVSPLGAPLHRDDGLFPLPHPTLTRTTSCPTSFFFALPMTARPTATFRLSKIEAWRRSASPFSFFDILGKTFFTFGFLSATSTGDSSSPAPEPLLPWQTYSQTTRTSRRPGPWRVRTSSARGRRNGRASLGFIRMERRRGAPANSSP